jgi:acetyl-CoA carboxylase carboxyltransferase component
LEIGGSRAIESQNKEKKGSARERIDYFFDPGTFTELRRFVKHRGTATLI